MPAHPKPKEFPPAPLRSPSPAGWRIWLLLLSLFASAWGGDQVPKEYQVKAAFLYNFAKFIEWPSGSFDGADSPIVIGVFGENPFGNELERLAKDHSINGHPIVVRSVQSAASARKTHLLFISTAEDGRFPDLGDAFKGSGTLTVGESEGFARRGGMICFVPEGDKLRFEINIGAVGQAGLKVSAQLQKLARSVRR